MTQGQPIPLVIPNGGENLCLNHPHFKNEILIQILVDCGLINNVDKGTYMYINSYQNLFLVLLLV